MPRAIGLMFCTVGLSGCLTSNVLVTVRPDGSGIVEHTTIVRLEALAQFEKLLPPELAGAPSRLSVAIGDPRQWRAEQRIGQEVRLLSATPVKTAETTGWAFTYEFDDVTTLAVDLIPVMPGMHGFYGIAAKQVGATTRLRMSLDTIPDGMERLTVRFPGFAMETTAEPPSSWASGSPEEMAVLRNVMKGAGLTLAVKTEAALIRTNSPYRDDNRVTLLDVDIEQALFSKQIAMLVATPATFEELLTISADLPGVTLAREHDITLDFQNPSLQPPTGTSPPSQVPVDTEVFVAAISTLNSKLVIGPPVNISRNPGYDNQPSFTPDGGAVLFSSARRGAPSTGRGRSAPSPEGQTDIYRYEISTRKMRQLTNTPEREYSPTVMPDGERVSVVRVESDGTQRLWSVMGTGAQYQTSLILPEVKPVGYQAWIDERTVALFVLGDGERPPTLQVADTVTGNTTVVTEGIGRSLQRIPSGGVSFVQREPANGSAPPSMMITQLSKSPDGPRTTPLIRPAGGATDPFVAWTPDGTLLMAVGSAIYRWRTGETDWTFIANLGSFRIHEVSRLAVSPKGDWLAIVGRAKHGTSIAR